MFFPFSKTNSRRKGQKPKLGGHFEDELDAAKRVNQLCKELGISLQNPEISETPNQKYEVTYDSLALWENHNCENLFQNLTLSDSIL